MGDVLKLGPHDSLEIVSSTAEALEVEASYRPLGSPPPAHFHPEPGRALRGSRRAMRARVDGEELELPERRRDRHPARPDPPDVEPRGGGGAGALGDDPRRPDRGVVQDPRLPVRGQRRDRPGAGTSTSPPCSRSTAMSSGSAPMAEPARPFTGLCDSCRHQQLVPNTRGSVFSLCQRSRDDPRYPRYPRIPVARLPRLRAARPGQATQAEPRALARRHRVRLAELGDVRRLVDARRACRRGRGGGCPRRRARPCA